MISLLKIYIIQLVMIKIALSRKNINPKIRHLFTKIIMIARDKTLKTKQANQ